MELTEEEIREMYDFMQMAASLGRGAQSLLGNLIFSSLSMVGGQETLEKQHVEKIRDSFDDVVSKVSKTHHDTILRAIETLEMAKVELQRHVSAGLDRQLH